MDAAHWQDQLAHRQAALVVVFFGANEADWTAATTKAMGEYQATFETLLGRIQAAAPAASCLVMSPLDSDSDKNGTLATKPTIPMLVEAQRAAAAAKGCAFWDSFAWMGGKGTMIRWRKRNWVSADYVHPTRFGAAQIGDALFGALLHGYEESSAMPGVKDLR